MASHVVVVQGPAVSFCPEDPKYKCCCNSCHVITGSMILGVLTAIYLFVTFIILVSCYADFGPSFAPYFWPDFLLIIGYAVLHISFFWGLKTEVPGLLIPYLVGQVIAMVYLVIVLILLIINVAGAGAIVNGEVPMTTQEFGEMYLTVSVLLLLLAMLLMGLQVWFFLVVKACFHYFKNKHSHRSAGGEQGYSGRYYKTGRQDSEPPPYSEK